MGGLAKRVRAYVRLNGVGYTLRRGMEKVRDRGLREYDRLYRRERAGEAELAQQRERKWQAAPLVSILVPVYNTDPAMLRRPRSPSAHRPTPIGRPSCWTAQAQNRRPCNA